MSRHPPGRPVGCDDAYRTPIHAGNPTTMFRAKCSCYPKKYPSSPRGDHVLSCRKEDLTRGDQRIELRICRSAGSAEDAGDAIRIICGRVRQQSRRFANSRSSSSARKCATRFRNYVQAAAEFLLAHILVFTVLITSGR